MGESGELFLTELSDSDVPIKIFTGNHDIWMFGYFTQELRISIFRNPKTIQIDNKKFHIGHGDGLEFADRIHKGIKRVFENKLGYMNIIRTIVIFSSIDISH